MFFFNNNSCGCNRQTQCVRCRYQQNHECEERKDNCCHCCRCCCHKEVQRPVRPNNCCCRCCHNMNDGWGGDMD